MFGMRSLNLYWIVEVTNQCLVTGNSFGNGDSPAYFLLLVQTVLNIIKIPPIKMAIAKPPAIESSKSVFSITYNHSPLNHPCLELR